MDLLKSALPLLITPSFTGITAAQWMIGYRGKGKGLVKDCLSPLVLPPTVMGFLLLLLLAKKLGPLGYCCNWE